MSKSSIKESSMKESSINEGSMKESSINEGSMKESSINEGSMKESSMAVFDHGVKMKTDWNPLRIKPTKSHKVVKKGTGSSGARRAIRNKSHRGGRKSRRNKRKSRKNRC